MASSGDPVTLPEGGDSVTEMRATRPEVSEGLARDLGVSIVRAGLFGGELPTVGRYVVQTKIGEGGMGVVFRAHDPALDRRVALKILRLGTSADEVRHEARALARFSHPNVLTVFDVGEHEGDLWIAMEYAGAGDLEHWVKQRPNLRWRELTERLLEAGRGLAAAHTEGIVHRDFKPANVMIGEDGRARVADFGLAVSNQRTQGDLRAGTPAYWAPEIAQGAPATAASDQYAYCAASMGLLDRCEGEPVPPELRRALKRGQDRWPGDRWPSMALLVRELERVVEAAPAGGRPLGVVGSGGHHVWVPGMMADDAYLLELATESPDRETFRTEALAWINKSIGFDTALLGQTELDGPAGPMIQNFDPVFVAQLRSNVAKYAPALMRMLMVSAERRTPIRDLDLYSHDFRQKDPFYAELIGPKGSRAMLVTSLVVRGEPVSSLQISRASRGSQFSDIEVRRIQGFLRSLAVGESLHRVKS